MILVGLDVSPVGHDLGGTDVSPVGHDLGVCPAQERVM